MRHSVTTTTMEVILTMWIMTSEGDAVNSDNIVCLRKTDGWIRADVGEHRPSVLIGRDTAVAIPQIVSAIISGTKVMEVE